MMTLNELLARFQPDVEVIERGRQRQAAVWHGRKPDSLPILVSGQLPADLKKLPRYNLKECWYDREKMLWNALLDMIAMCEAKSDGCPSMRANLGCGVMATVFGCRQLVFEDKMPWIHEHLSREAIDAADISAAETKGDVPRVLDYMTFFRDRLGDKAHVYCADVQGPFDIAHLVYGDAIFTDMYDAPAFVHRLLDKCTNVYIAVTQAMKSVNGEAADQAYHYNGLYVERAGTRTSEDTTTLISPAQVREFALPYTVRAFAPFRGGYVHYCGNGENLRHLFMAEPTVRGFNFGNPEMHDMPKVVGEIIASGRVYYGGWPRQPEEGVRQYFRRVLKSLEGVRTGFIFTPTLRPEDGDRRRIVQLWRELQ